MTTPTAVAANAYAALSRLHDDAAKIAGGLGNGLESGPNFSALLKDAMNAVTTAAQTEFFHATNAAAVEGVLEAIESQVERAQVPAPRRRQRAPFPGRPARFPRTKPARAQNRLRRRPLSARHRARALRGAGGAVSMRC